MPATSRASRRCPSGRGSSRFYDSDNLTYAASIAYYALLSLFPFFLLALALLGGVDRRRRQPQRGARVRPPLLSRAVRFHHHAARRVPGDAVTVGVAGTLALVWGALGVFGAISTAVNYAWGVEKQRSFWKHKLFSFVMLLVAGADSR